MDLRGEGVGVTVAPLRPHRGWLVPLAMLVVYGVGRPLCLVTQAVLRTAGLHPEGRRTGPRARTRWY